MKPSLLAEIKFTTMYTINQCKKTQKNRHKSKKHQLN